MNRVDLITVTIGISSRSSFPKNNDIWWIKTSIMWHCRKTIVLAGLTPSILLVAWNRITTISQFCVRFWLSFCAYSRSSVVVAWAQQMLMHRWAAVFWFTMCLYHLSRILRQLICLPRSVHSSATLCIDSLVENVYSLIHE